MSLLDFLLQLLISEVKRFENLSAGNSVRYVQYDILLRDRSVNLVREQIYITIIWIVLLFYCR